MKGAFFSGYDPISVLGFLARFKAACDRNGLHDSAAMWCFTIFMTGLALTRTQGRLLRESRVSDRRRKETLTSYPEVVNYLLRTCATDEVKVEAYLDVANYIPSSGMSEM